MEISNRTAGKFQKITLHRAFQRKGALVAGLLQRTEERGIVLPVPGLGEEPSVFGAGDMGMGQQAPVTGKGGAGLPLQVKMIQVHQQTNAGFVHLPDQPG